jgi:uncharacterized protein YjbJ (UPF0337 family)
MLLNFHARDINHFSGTLTMTDRDKTLRNDGIENSVKGKATEAKGKLKDAAGALTGNSKMQASGKIDQARGKVQDAIGKAERRADK